MLVEMEEEESVAVQMGPLIDCVFLLLIFFILVALTKKKHREIVIEHPHAAVSAPESPPRGGADGEAERPEKIVVKIERTRRGARERLLLGSEEVTIETLRQRLLKMAAEEPLATVVIQPHKDTTLEAIVQVMDACKFARLSKVALRPRMSE